MYLPLRGGTTHPNMGYRTRRPLRCFALSSPFHMDQHRVDPTTCAPSASHDPNQEPMKNNYAFPVLAVLLLVSVPARPQCSIAYTANNPGYSASSVPIVYGQSFVATCDGNMQYFELIANETGTISASTINVYSGNTTSGSPIYTQSHPAIVITAPGAPIRFTITGTLPLVMNEQYTFEFTLDNVDFLYDEQDGYAGGSAWQDGDPVDEVDLLFTVSVGTSLGVDGHAVHPGAVLYPSPSSSFIAINGLKQPTAYILYDALGGIIMADRVSDGEQIDVKHIARGSYYVRLENGSVLQFIKE